MSILADYDYGIAFWANPYIGKETKMVLQVMKWDVHPDKVDEYLKWAETAIKRIISVPGLVEFRAYRPASGSSQVVTTCECKDMNAWATWQGHEDMQNVMFELHSLALNVEVEVWGPSPIVPKPVRPGN
jgi:antibiotic biosynthesis monooxygenase (ABM) superfamily enzyme